MDVVAAKRRICSLVILHNRYEMKINFFLNYFMTETRATIKLAVLARNKKIKYNYKMPRRKKRNFLIFIKPINRMD